MRTIIGRESGLLARWMWPLRPASERAPRRAEAARPLPPAQAVEVAAPPATPVAIPGDLYPFQRAGVAYVVGEAKYPGRAIIGDSMGLGKTRQGISVLETRQAYPAMVVVPAGGRSNWKRELAELVPHRSVCVLTDVAAFVQSDIYVVAYDSLDTWANQLVGTGALNGLVFDEVHRIKSASAQRTQAAHRLAAMVPDSGVVLGLTGTVITNRPAELIEPLKVIGIFYGLFYNEPWYRANYCSKNTTIETLEALNLYLRQTCYIRREMEDVLDDFPALMPPQVHLVDVLPPSRMRTYQAIESDVVDYVRETRGDVAAESTAKAAALVTLGALRHEVGRVKVEEAIDWTRGFIAETTRSVIVFAWHEDVQESIAAGLRGRGITTTALSGGMSPADTALAVDGFQKGVFQVIVCSLQAASEGHTLTAACDVLFAELPWTPAMYDQAVARARRIGQTATKVFSHNLLVAGTIDTRLAEIIDEKRAVTTAVTEGAVQAQLLAAVARGTL